MNTSKLLLIASIILSTQLTYAQNSNKTYWDAVARTTRITIGQPDKKNSVLILLEEYIGDEIDAFADKREKNQNPFVTLTHKQRKVLTAEQQKKLLEDQQKFSTYATYEPEADKFTIKTSTAFLGKTLEEGSLLAGFFNIEQGVTTLTLREMQTSKTKKNDNLLLRFGSEQRHFIVFEPNKDVIDPAYKTQATASTIVGDLSDLQPITFIGSFDREYALDATQTNMSPIDPNILDHTSEAKTFYKNAADILAKIQRIENKSRSQTNIILPKGYHVTLKKDLPVFSSDNTGTVDAFSGKITTEKEIYGVKLEIYRTGANYQRVKIVITKKSTLSDNPKYRYESIYRARGIDH